MSAGARLLFVIGAIIAFAVAVILCLVAADELPGQLRAILASLGVGAGLYAVARI